MIHNLWRMLKNNEVPLVETRVSTFIKITKEGENRNFGRIEFIEELKRAKRKLVEAKSCLAIHRISNEHNFRLKKLKNAYRIISSLKKENDQNRSMLVTLQKVVIKLPRLNVDRCKRFAEGRPMKLLVLS